MTELPSSFYTVVGILVIGQFATLITMLGLIFKAGMFVKETQLGVKDAKDTAVRAHLRIDDLKGKRVSIEAP